MEPSGVALGQLTDTNEAGRYTRVRIVIVFSVLASATDFFVIFNMRLLSLLASSAILPALLLLACVAFVAW